MQSGSDPTKLFPRTLKLLRADSSHNVEGTELFRRLKSKLIFSRNGSAGHEVGKFPLKLLDGNDNVVMLPKLQSTPNHGETDEQGSNWSQTEAFIEINSKSDHPVLFFQDTPPVDVKMSNNASSWVVFLEGSALTEMTR
jgi:hypothetical protein